MTLSKLCFKIAGTPTLREDSEEYLFYSVKNIEILKVDIYTFSFMAKYSFVNLTGCTSYDSVVHAINLFKHFTGINEIFNLKINTMSATMSRSREMSRPSVEKFYEIKYQRFPGVVYKVRDTKNGKYGCTFFARNIVFFGIKSFRNIKSDFSSLFPNE